MKISLPPELTDLYYIGELDFLNYLENEDANKSIYIMLHPYMFNTNSSKLSDYARAEVNELLKAHANNKYSNNSAIYQYYSSDNYDANDFEDEDLKQEEIVEPDFVIMTTTHYILDE